MNLDPIEVLMVNPTSYEIVEAKMVSPWDFRLVNGGGDQSLTQLIASGDFLSAADAAMMDQKVYIGAFTNLIIDQDYTFTTDQNSLWNDGSEIFLEEGARITIGEVGNPVHVDFLHTLVHGGCELWDRIEVRPGSSVTFRETYIEGGQYGLYLANDYDDTAPPSDIIFRSVDIEDCLYGIYTPSHDYSSDEKLPYRIYAENLDIFGQGDLPSAFAGMTQLIPENHRPIAGIHAVNWESIMTEERFHYDFWLPWSTQFSDMRTGIVATDVDVEIQRSYFSDLTNGIVMDQRYHSTLVVGQDPQYNNRITSFRDINKCAIDAHTFSLEVEKVNFTNCERGIRLQQVAGGFYVITKSNFTEFYRGITSIFNLGETINILGNDFSSTSHVRATAILMYDNGLYTGSEARIKDNAIDLRTSRGGIYVSGGDGILIDDNTIDLTASSSWPAFLDRRVGVQIWGGRSAKVEENVITVQRAQQGTEVKEMHVLHCDYAEITCNNENFEPYDESEMPDIALHMEGDCNYSRIRGNALGGEYTNLLYGPISGTSHVIAGVQRGPGNLYQHKEPASGFGAVYNGDPDPDIVERSIHLADDEANLGQHFPRSTNVADWFSVGGYVPHECASSISGVAGDIVAEDIGSDAYVQKIRDGDLAGGHYPDRVAWTLRRQLYRYLLYQDQLTPGQQNFMLFYTPTSVGQYELFYHGIEQLIEASEAEKAALSLQRELMAQALDQVRILIDAGVDWEDSQVGNAMNGYHQARIAHAVLAKQYAASRASGLTQLATLATQLPNPTAWESAERIMAEAIIEGLHSDPSNLPPQMMTNVHSVATGCIEAQGDVVFKAAPYLLLDDAAWSPNYTHYCLPTSQGRRASDDDTSPLRVWPNPASDVVHFVLAGMDMDGLEILLSGMDGRIWPLGELRGSNIDVARIPSGLYILQARTQSGRIYHELLFIQ